MSQEISSDLIIAMALSSFFTIGIITFALNIISYGSYILGAAMLIVGFIEILFINNLYRNLKNNDLKGIINELNHISYLNIIFSSIMFFIISISLLEAYLINQIALDLLILYILYSVILLIGLGLLSGIYAWRSVNKVYKQVG